MPAFRLNMSLAHAKQKGHGQNVRSLPILCFTGDGNTNQRGPPRQNHPITDEPRKLTPPD